MAQVRGKLDSSARGHGVYHPSLPSPNHLPNHTLSQYPGYARTSLRCADVAAFLEGRSAFRRLVYSQDMAPDMDVSELRARFPWVSFSAMD